MPTVADVRKFLSNLSEQRVGDDTIELQLRVAETLVDAEKSAAATAEQVDETKLAYAVYLTMLSYASQIERSTGVVPTPIISHLVALEALYKRMLEIVKRGAPTYIPMNEQWETLIEQYEVGDLSGDYY